VSEEASGLIDIRSLAGSLSDPKDTTGVEDLISMSGGGFAPSLGAPVLAAQKESMSLGTKIGIIGGSVAVLAVIVVLAVMVLSPDKSVSDDHMKQLLEQEISKKLKEQGAGASAEAAALRKQLEAAKQQSSVVKEDTTSEERVAKAEPTPKASSSSSSSKGSTSSSKSSTSTRKSSSSTKSSTTKKKTSSELDDLLGPGIGGTTKKKTSTSSKKSSSSSSTSTTKAKLSRSDVQKGMNSVARRVKNCGQGKSGTITLKVVIGSSGRVVSATPTGAFAGTPIGSCAVRAVKSARFPKAASSLTVKYPFKF
jgi:membrane protein involved in colicin uptake